MRNESLEINIHNFVPCQKLDLPFLRQEQAVMRLT